MSLEYRNPFAGAGIRISENRTIDNVELVLNKNGFNVVRRISIKAYHDCIHDHALANHIAKTMHEELIACMERERMALIPSYDSLQYAYQQQANACGIVGNTVTGAIAQGTITADRVVGNKQANGYTSIDSIQQQTNDNTLSKKQRLLLLCNH